MGFLKNIVSNAVSDGIGKGISSAVGKAVESTVKPAAEKLADKAAEHMNETAKVVEMNSEAIKAAGENLAQTVSAAEWEEKLPQYPKWTLSGSVEISTGDMMNGYPLYFVQVAEAGMDELNAYVDLLKNSGFVPYSGDDSDVYYKNIDGVCRAFDKTDADQGDGLNLTFFVGDFGK